MQFDLCGLCDDKESFPPIANICLHKILSANNDYVYIVTLECSYFHPSQLYQYTHSNYTITLCEGDSSSYASKIFDEKYADRRSCCEIHYSEDGENYIDVTPDN